MGKWDMGKDSDPTLVETDPVMKIWELGLRPIADRGRRLYVFYTLHYNALLATPRLPKFTIGGNRRRPRHVCAVLCSSASLSSPSRLKLLLLSFSYNFHSAARGTTLYACSREAYIWIWTHCEW